MLSSTDSYSSMKNNRKMRVPSWQVWKGMRPSLTLSDFNILSLWGHWLFSIWPIGQKAAVRRLCGRWSLGHTCPWRAEQPEWCPCCQQRAHTHSAGSTGGCGGRWNVLAGTRNTGRPHQVLTAASGAARQEERLGDRRKGSEGPGDCPLSSASPEFITCWDDVDDLTKAERITILIYLSDLIWFKKRWSWRTGGSPPERWAPSS